MSAFDNLKLAMIPTAWKEDKLYSAIPEQTNTDVLEESRLSAAHAGLTWDGSTLSSDGTASGYKELSRLASKGMTYELTLTANLNGSLIRIYAEGNTGLSLQDGTNTYTFVHSGAGVGNIIRLLISTDNVFTLSNISLIEKSNGDFHVQRGSSGTRLYGSGLLQTITDTDAPRLDYTFGGAPSVLLEPQRENLITYSENLSHSTWTGNAISRSQDYAFTNPTGGLGATKISGNGGNGYHNVRVSFPATGSTVTHSVFVKGDNLSHFEFIETYGGSPYATAQYDLQNVTATITQGTLFSNARIEPFSNGWYRCFVTASAYNSIHLNISDGSTTTGITTVESDESIYMWGAQTEAGSYPTSYIATSGTAVTRSRDIITFGGVTQYFNLDEGTLYFHGKVDDDFDGLGFFRMRSRDNRNLVELYFQSANLFIREKINNVWGAQDNLGGNYIKGEFFKFAVTYNKNGTRKGYQNGTQMFSKTDSGDFTANSWGLQRIDFDGGSNDLEIKGAYYFDRALTDAELEKLTSSDITQVLASYNNRAQYFGAFYESSHVETKLNELF